MTILSFDLSGQFTDPMVSDQIRIDPELFQSRTYRNIRIMAVHIRYEVIGEGDAIVFPYEGAGRNEQINFLRSIRAPSDRGSSSGAIDRTSLIKITT